MTSCDSDCIVVITVLLQGISFLDVKNHLMLSYIMNLTHVMCHKVSGKSICGSPDVERLVEIRTVGQIVFILLACFFVCCK